MPCQLLGQRRLDDLGRRRRRQVERLGHELADRSRPPPAVVLRPAQVQLVAGAGHADVEQPPLLARRASRPPGSGRRGRARRASRARRDGRGRGTGRPPGRRGRRRRTRGPWPCGRSGRGPRRRRPDPASTSAVEGSSPVSMSVSSCSTRNGSRSSRSRLPCRRTISKKRPTFASRSSPVSRASCASRPSQPVEVMKWYSSSPQERSVLMARCASRLPSSRCTTSSARSVNGESSGCSAASRSATASGARRRRARFSASVTSPGARPKISDVARS